MVARCTVKCLMRKLGVAAAARGKMVGTTISDASAPYLQDRVNRQFKADRLNQLRVADFTYVSLLMHADFVLERLQATTTP